MQRQVQHNNNVATGPATTKRTGIAQLTYRKTELTWCQSACTGRDYARHTEFSTDMHTKDSRLNLPRTEAT